MQFLGHLGTMIARDCFIDLEQIIIYCGFQCITYTAMFKFTKKIYLDIETGLLVNDVEGIKLTSLSLCSM